MPRPMTRESLWASHARSQREHASRCSAGHHTPGRRQQGEDGRVTWECFWCGHQHFDDPATPAERAAEEGCAAYRRHLEEEARRTPTRAEQAASGALVSVPADAADAAGFEVPVVFTPAAWDRCGCGDPARLAAVLADTARALHRNGRTARFFALRSIALRARSTTFRDGAHITVCLPKEHL